MGETPVIPVAVIGMADARAWRSQSVGIEVGRVPGRRCRLQLRVLRHGRTSLRLESRPGLLMRWPTKAPVSPRTDTTSTAGAGGVFRRLGDFVVRWPWVVIGCWVALAVVLPPLFPSLAEVTQKQPVSPLPASAPSIVATQQMAAAFHEAGSRERAPGAPDQRQGAWTG